MSVDGASIYTSWYYLCSLQMYYILYELFV